jgi:DNA-directed RNA polymerase subunit H (RpoH/RPB5)
MDKAIQTVTEMITQREYLISSEDEEKIIAKNKSNDHILAYKTPIGKFNVERFKEYISKLETLNNESDDRKYIHVILIYTDCITPTGKRMVAESNDIIFELFSIGELQFNITKHRLVPLHQRLEESESKEFKEKYGLKYQSILISDPISRFYFYKRGDVIKIYRPRKKNKHFNQGFIISYRIVKG